jgi:hypothetical protein
MFSGLRKTRSLIRRLGVDLAARILRRYLVSADTRVICRHYGFEPSRLDYMSPIPNVDTLPDSAFSSRYETASLRLDAKKQLGFLNTVYEQYGLELDFPEHTDDPHRYHRSQGAFTHVDASVLYMMVRHFRPRYIIEIGSGYSTTVTAAAARKNAEEGPAPEFITVDPFPRDYLKGLPGLSEAVPAEVQKLPPQFFSRLRRRDILFIDSSHIVRCHSDVIYLLLKVLPSLAPGTIVHLHDIYLPYEYPKKWMLNGYYYNESYFLHAFLAFNTAFETILASHFLDNEEGKQMRALFGDDLSGPTSYWIEKSA